MDWIRIRTEREKKRQNCHPVPMLIFLITGVYGLLLFFQGVQGVSYQRFVIYPVCGLMCVLAWYLYYRKKSWFFLYAAIMTAVMCTIVYEYQESVLLEAENVVKGFMGLLEEEEQVTLLMLPVSWCLVLLLFVLQIIVKRHSILYLLLCTLMLSGPLLGIWTGVEAMFLLLVFQAAFFAAHKTGSARKGRLLAEFDKESLAGRSSAYMGLILVAVLMISVPVVYWCAEKLYQSVYEAEGYLARTVSSMLGTENNLVRGGRVGRGNNYQTGTEQIVVRSTKKPEQIMYLKGFTGGIYVGGEWEQADDTPLLEKAAQAMGWQRWLRTIEGMYNNMYYTMNSNMWLRSRPRAGMLTVRHLNGNYEDFYAPYYGQRINENAYSWYGLPDYGYGYWFYEQGEMRISWDAPMGEFDAQKSWYRQLSKEYRKEAEVVYTQTPPGLVPRLTELCRNNPQSSLEDITAFILYTLHSNATYSLTPGWAALNDDVVEYFLFERKSGYCVHFASAAVLMYRMYGVPARYAAGYIVQPEDFMIQEDGAYLASITDEAAHAWVEIFLDEYGWTPVEVTPSASGEIGVCYPGFDGVALEQLMQEKGWNMDMPSLKESGTIRQRGSGTATFRWRPGWSTGKTVPFFADCFLYMLCFLPLLFHFRRERGRKRFETMGCQGIFGRLLELLHFGGFLAEYNGMEEDFADRLSEEVPSISKELAQQIVRSAMKAAYGKTEEQTEERESMRQCYCCTAEYIYGRIGWSRRLLFRYWKIFG